MEQTLWNMNTLMKTINDKYNNNRNKTGIIIWIKKVWLMIIHTYIYFTSTCSYCTHIFEMMNTVRAINQQQIIKRCKSNMRLIIII